jgi:hypothetical protein
MRATALIFLFLAAFPAGAFADGMYLCHTPVSAANLWRDVITAQQAGVQLTPEILKNVELIKMNVPWFHQIALHR